MHAVDLIRKTRDAVPLTAEEMHFLVQGAAERTIPDDQLAAWLMAVFLQGLSHEELHAFTTAMLRSGEVFDPAPMGRVAVDKHSTGGVGDKTSFLVAPIAAAAGLIVPMVSGRGLGHTGGTLDKLESIPGYRTQLSLAEMGRVLEQCGVSIVGQTERLVPADRVLYALRDHVGAVESVDLICASIMSKKLAASPNALVLDAKTGSGAFLKSREESLHLAALMVQIGEAAGTRTCALLTSMDQPLGRMVGNWIEIQEAVELLRNQRHPLNEDLRELSLTLAGWMLQLGGVSATPEAGYAHSEQLLASGEAFAVFQRMVRAQGGDTGVLDRGADFHTPKHRRTLLANRDGHLSSMNCEQVGLAVQRLGAGRSMPGEPVDAHAGIELHVKLGGYIRQGEPLCTLFAEDESEFEEPELMLRQAFILTDTPAAIPQLIQQIVTIDNANQFRRASRRMLGRTTH